MNQHNLVKLLTATFLSAGSFAYNSTAYGQDEAQVAGARAAGEAGISAYKSGDFNGCVNYFGKAQELVNAPTHLRYIALCHEKLGNLVQARENYNKLVRFRLDDNDSESFRRAVEGGRAELEALEPRVPRLTVKVTGTLPSGSTFSVGELSQSASLIGIPIPVNPGPKKVVIRYKDQILGETEIDLKEGASDSIEIETKEAELTAEAVAEGDNDSSPADSPIRYEQRAGASIWISGGVGVVGAINAGIFLGLYLAKGSEIDSNICGNPDSPPPPNCLTGQSLDDAQSTEATYGTVAAISGIVGGLGLITATTLWLTGLGMEDVAIKTGSLTITPLVAPSYIGFHGSF